MSCCRANNLALLRVLYIVAFLLPTSAFAQKWEVVLPREDDPEQYYYVGISCSDERNCTIGSYAFDKDEHRIRFLLERTTDGGLTWNQQPAPFKNQRSEQERKWTCVFAVDSLHVFAFGDSGMVARTTDAGKNWADVSLNDYRGIAAASFIDPENGFIVGGGGLAYVTSNGGISWDSIAGLPFRVFTSAKMFSVDSFATYRLGIGPVYRTTDRWKAIDTTNYLFDPAKFSLDTPRNLGPMIWKSWDEMLAFGYVFYPRPDETPAYEYHPWIERSQDGGKTWTTQYEKKSYVETLNPVSILSSGFGLAGGERRGLLRTTDWGHTWTDDTVQSDVFFLEASDIAMVNDYTALIDFSQFSIGKIVRVTYPKSSVEGFREKVLYGTEIYPNPATNKIVVKKLYNNDRSYSVIDMVGREVLRGKLNYGPGTTTLDCSGLLDGSYSLIVKFDLGNLPAGHFVILK